MLELLLGGEVQAESEAVEDGRAQIDDRRAGNLIALSGEVFDRREYFHIVTDTAANLSVHGIEAIQGELVLIVGKLPPNEAALQAQQQARRIPVARRPGKRIAGHLGNIETREGNGRRNDRVADHSRCGEFVSGGELNIAVEVHDAVEIETARAD